MVCPGCMENLKRAGRSCCLRCGAPVTGKSGAVCDQCRDMQFAFTRNESIGVYGGEIRDLIRLYKFTGRRSLASVFARFALAEKKMYIERHDVLVPVPLTRRRHHERGFNQSALLAHRISRGISTPLLVRALCRRGNALPQSSITSLAQRKRNMTDRYYVRKRVRNRLSGLNVLLVDDVLTTGATASACAKALYCAGAVNVDLFTIARAVKETVPGERFG